MTISIITVAYNNKPGLEATINSVINLFADKVCYSRAKLLDDRRSMALSLNVKPSKRLNERVDFLEC
ncbi:MAG: hypothetical protein EOO18_07745, partial [Chryseobacterium sp.]